VKAAERRSLRLVAELLDRAAEILLELAGDEGDDEMEAPRRGRPRTEVTPAQEAEVLRLRLLNGRLGYRAIGKRVKPCLPWRFVKSIVDEHESAFQKDVESSRNSSAESRGGAA
jgi:hypothetical protein